MLLRCSGQRRGSSSFASLSRTTSTSSGQSSNGANGSAVTISVASLRSQSSPILTYNRVRSGRLLPRASTCSLLTTARVVVGWMPCGWPGPGYPSERDQPTAGARAGGAGWGSPERSIRGSDGVPTVRERDGGDRADWSARRARREILGGPRPRATEGSSRERCGAKGIPSLASSEASGAAGLPQRSC